VRDALFRHVHQYPNGPIARSGREASRVVSNLGTKLAVVHQGQCIVKQTGRLLRKEFQDERLNRGCNSQNGCFRGLTGWVGCRNAGGLRGRGERFSEEGPNHDSLCLGPCVARICCADQPCTLPSAVHLTLSRAPYPHARMASLQDLSPPLISRYQHAAAAPTFGVVPLISPPTFGVVPLIPSPHLGRGAADSLPSSPLPASRGAVPLPVRRKGCGYQQLLRMQRASRCRRQCLQRHNGPRRQYPLAAILQVTIPSVATIHLYVSRSTSVTLRCRFCCLRDYPVALLS